MQSFGDIIVLANKKGWQVVEKVVSTKHYVYDNGNTNPLGKVVKAKTTYDIKRGKTYWYRDVPYTEMVAALNNLVDDQALADDKNETKHFKTTKKCKLNTSRQRKNKVDELLTHFERN